MVLYEVSSCPSRSTTESLSLANAFRPVTKLGHGPDSSSSRLGVSCSFLAIMSSFQSRYAGAETSGWAGISGLYEFCSNGTTQFLDPVHCLFSILRCQTPSNHYP